jgi:pilus assembly protein Flp/PilA
MRKILQKLVRNESGATAIEYGLIAALLAVGIIAAVQGVGKQLNTTFKTVSTTLSNSNTVKNTN